MIRPLPMTTTCPVNTGAGLMILDLWLLFGDKSKIMTDGSRRRRRAHVAVPERLRKDAEG
jgi:hypothetical protein